ncbi:hypothetical protein Q9R46_17005 [Paenibacillus sp. RRE4]|uniref:hypothetical protein n=1 Tax=Paenibacillus sp. RRE4 TaxID=2962587 RepID=UPI00288144DE|nr:hypothetical protein [Paenibacillus sp. RRE4]MDT0124361.1 hypothetical protein [Paenibacillus sp. RRE4]
MQPQPQPLILDSFRCWMQSKQEQLQVLQISTEERKENPEDEKKYNSDPFIGYVHESGIAMGQVTLWASRQMEFEVINIDTEERLVWTYVEQIEEQEDYFNKILKPYFGALQFGVKV